MRHRTSISNARQQAIKGARPLKVEAQRIRKHNLRCSAQVKQQDGRIKKEGGGSAQSRWNALTPAAYHQFTPLAKLLGQTLQTSTSSDSRKGRGVHVVFRLLHPDAELLGRLMELVVNKASVQELAHVSHHSLMEVDIPTSLKPNLNGSLTANNKQICSVEVAFEV